MGAVASPEEALVGSDIMVEATRLTEPTVLVVWGQAASGKFGALRGHVDEGLLTRHTLHAELGEIVAGSARGRERPDERILARGLATRDIAVAYLIWQRARAVGLGTVLTYHQRASKTGRAWRARRLT